MRIYGSGSTGFNGGSPGVPAGADRLRRGALLGVADGSQTSATTATTSTSSYWVADTIALKPLQGSTSISVPVPANEAAGDLMLVSVNARGLGSNGTVCAPDTSWQQVPAQSSYPVAGGATSVTVATFESARGADSQPYVFTFSGDGSCSAASLVSVSASAMAVRYTGVDPVSPIDVSAAGRNNGTTATAGAVTTVFAGDRIVRVYGTGGSAFSGGAPGVPAGQSVNNGTVALLGIADGTTSGATTATVAAADNWVANTIALKPQQGATTISVPVPVNETSGDVVVVSVAARGLAANATVCPPDASWQQQPVEESQPNAGGTSSDDARNVRERAGGRPTSGVVRLRVQQRRFVHGGVARPGLCLGDGGPLRRCRHRHAGRRCAERESGHRDDADLAGCDDGILGRPCPACVRDRGECLHDRRSRGPGGEQRHRRAPRDERRLGNRYSSGENREPGRQLAGELDRPAAPAGCVVDPRAQAEQPGGRRLPARRRDRQGIAGRRQHLRSRATASTPGT